MRIDSEQYYFIYAKNTLGRTPPLCVSQQLHHSQTDYTHIPISQTENFQAQPTTPPGGHKNSTLLEISAVLYSNRDTLHKSLFLQPAYPLSYHMREAVLFCNVCTAKILQIPFQHSAVKVLCPFFPPNCIHTDLLHTFQKKSCIFFKGGSTWLALMECLARVLIPPPLLMHCRHV